MKGVMEFHKTKPDDQASSFQKHSADLNVTGTAEVISQAAWKKGELITKA